MVQIQVPLPLLIWRRSRSGLSVLELSSRSQRMKSAECDLQGLMGQVQQMEQRKRQGQGVRLWAMWAPVLWVLRQLRGRLEQKDLVLEASALQNQHWNCKSLLMRRPRRRLGWQGLLLPSEVLSAEDRGSLQQDTVGRPRWYMYIVGNYRRFLNDQSCWSPRELLLGGILQFSKQDDLQRQSGTTGLYMASWDVLSLWVGSVTFGSSLTLHLVFCLLLPVLSVRGFWQSAGDDCCWECWSGLGQYILSLVCLCIGIHIKMSRWNLKFIGLGPLILRWEW